MKEITVQYDSMLGDYYVGHGAVVNYKGHCGKCNAFVAVTEEI